MAGPDDVLITSDRLVIRRLRLADSDVVHAYKNDPDIARFQGWQLPYPLEMVRADIAADATRLWPCSGEGMNIAIGRIEIRGEWVDDATYVLTSNDRAVSAAHDGAAVTGDDLTDGVGTGP